MSELHFILNEEEIQTSCHPGLLVLDFLREGQRLTGTKEGCREGDCGACAILIGELIDDKVRYQSVTSCLVPLGELNGKHVVTIEGLNDTHLSPVQQAIVNEGASQCGFCTPGIVVSMTGYLIDRDGDIDLNGIKEALGGHLCRCTGYRSLKDAGFSLSESLSDRLGLVRLAEVGAIPSYFTGIPERLRSLGKKLPGLQNVVDGSFNSTASGDGFLIAGGTDLYVQHGDEIPMNTPVILNLRAELGGIREQDSSLHIGAATTFTEFAKNPLVRTCIPSIQGYMEEIASVQIRNRATLAGNIINASPVGDITILLLALGAELLFKGNDGERRVALSNFYRSYKEFDKSPDEILLEIRMPKPHSEARINWEKVSKRTYLDIASVNSAACIRVDSGSSLTIIDATLTAGGVAPIPMILEKTGSFLRGKEISTLLLRDANEVAQDEIAPIDDVRGSEKYKRLLLRQLLKAHFVRLFPEYTNTGAEYV